VQFVDIVSLPQGLKPGRFLLFFGTAEAVPFQNVRLCGFVGYDLVLDG
jgi:hypothetical protein